MSSSTSRSPAGSAASAASSSVRIAWAVTSTATRSAWPGTSRSGATGRTVPVLAGLVPAMLADQVGGDPIQPGPGIGVTEVIPVPLGESGQARLGDQVIGNLRASTPGKVAVNVGRVPVKQDREPLRLPPGTLNDRGVIRGGGSLEPPHARP